MFSNLRQKLKKSQTLPRASRRIQALGIENPEFSARNARSYPYPARLAPLHKIAPIRLFAQGDQAYCANFAFDRRLKGLKAKPVRGMRLLIRGSRVQVPDGSPYFETVQALSCRGSALRRRFLQHDTVATRLV